MEKENGVKDRVRVFVNASACVVGFSYAVIDKRTNVSVRVCLFVLDPRLRWLIFLSKRCQVSRHRRTTRSHTPHTVTRYLLLNFLPGNLALACLTYPPDGHCVYGSIESKFWDRRDHVSVNFVWLKKFDVVEQEISSVFFSWAVRLDGVISLVVMNMQNVRSLLDRTQACEKSIFCEECR